MELTPIGKEKLEISLTKSDMEKYRISSEELDYGNTQTRRAVWAILDKAKEQTGFDAANGKIRIDALPCPGGGCVIFITKTEAKMNGPQEKLPAVREKTYRSVYAFPGMEELLCVCRFLFVRGYAGESRAFMEGEESRSKNKYYLALTERMSYRDKSPYSVFENIFIGEFGKKLSEEHAFAYINEHCECFCPKNAVAILSEMAQ